MSPLHDVPRTARNLKLGALMMTVPLKSQLVSDVLCWPMRYQTLRPSAVITDMPPMVEPIMWYANEISRTIEPPLQPEPS